MKIIVQQGATEKSTVVEHRKGSGIADNLTCVGVGALVGIVLAGARCVYMHLIISIINNYNSYSWEY